MIPAVRVAGETLAGRNHSKRRASFYPMPAEGATGPRIMCRYGRRSRRLKRHPPVWPAGGRKHPTGLTRDTGAIYEKIRGLAFRA